MQFCSVDPNFSRPLVMYIGENAAEQFVCVLQQEAKQLFDEHIATPKPMLLTAIELQSFNNTMTSFVFYLISYNHQESLNLLLH